MAVNGPDDGSWQYPDSNYDPNMPGGGRIVTDVFGQRPSTDTVDASGGGDGFNPMDFIKQFTSGEGTIDWQDIARRAAAAGTALNQWNNSGKYMDLATKYKDEVNPFDLAQRKYYQGLLQQSYTDPTTFLQDPGHTATLDKQMNVLQGRLRGTGYMGSGKEGMDLADFQAQSDAQYLQKEREQLAGLAGSNIGPQSAADLIKTGITGSMQSQSDALGSLMKALAPEKGPTTVNNLTGGLTNPGGGDFSKYLTSGATWAKSLASGKEIPWSELARLGKLDLYDPEYQAFLKAQGAAETGVTNGNGGVDETFPGISPPPGGFTGGGQDYFFPDPLDGSMGPQLDGWDWTSAFFDK